jgi:hypothetical protein
VNPPAIAEISDGMSELADAARKIESDTSTITRMPGTSTHRLQTSKPAGITMTWWVFNLIQVFKSRAPLNFWKFYGYSLHMSLSLELLHYKSFAAKVRDIQISLFRHYPAHARSWLMSNKRGLLFHMVFLCKKLRVRKWRRITFCFDH